MNCLTEIFVDRALERAAELDAHLKKSGKVVGPLHGLPISLKDQLRMKGLETTMGEDISYPIKRDGMIQEFMLQDMCLGLETMLSAILRWSLSSTKPERSLSCGRMFHRLSWHENTIYSGNEEHILMRFIL